MDICVKWADMQEAEKEYRLLGFKRNMLFFSRDSLETWNKVFRAVFDADLLSFLSPKDGYAGTGFAVNEDNRPRLEKNLKMLNDYAENLTPVPPSVWRCFTPGNREKAVGNECRELAAILTLALGMPGAKIIFD